MLNTSLLVSLTSFQLLSLNAALGLILTGSVVYALRAPFTRWLFWYLNAQILATICIYGSLLFVTETSKAYHWLYFACTSIILASILLLAGTALRRHSAPWLALISAIGISGALAWLIWHEVGKPTPAEFIHIYEGFFLLLGAICLGGSAPYLEKHQREQALSLTLLFFCQALFRWGFCLHIKNLAWIEANDIMPFMMSTSTYLWIGMRARDRH